MTTLYLVMHRTSNRVNNANLDGALLSQSNLLILLVLWRIGQSLSLPLFEKPLLDSLSLHSFCICPQFLGPVPGLDHGTYLEQQSICPLHNLLHNLATARLARRKDLTSIWSAHRFRTNSFVMCEESGLTSGSSHCRCRECSVCRRDASSIWRNCPS